MPDAMDPMTLAMLSGDPDALKTMRQYALAQKLQEMSLGGAQQPQQLGLEGTRYPHAARVGPIAAVAPLVEAFMAQKGFEKAGPAMSQLYSRAAGAFGDRQVPGTPLQAAPPPEDPNAQGVQPLVQRLPGADLAQTVQASQPQTVHSPMNPLGLPPGLALQAWLKDPAKYAELIAGTPEWRTALAMTGGNAPQAMRMLQAEATKKGTIPLRPSETAMIPQAGGGTQTVTAPAAPHFEEDPFHPGQGHWVPGYQPPNAPPQSQQGKYFAPVTPHPGGGSGGGTAAALEQEKKGAESGQVYSDELNKNAENATELRASLAELKNLAKAGGVSASNPAKLELGSYLIAAGMDPQTVGAMFHTDVGALVAASKQTGNLAINSIHKFTSRGSNFDLATFMKYNPNLDMGSQEGFQRVIDFMDRRLQQDIAKQADFDHWTQTSKVPPNRWASAHTSHWLGLQNKLINIGATSSGAPQITPEDIAAEKARRGLQ